MTPDSEPSGRPSLHSDALAQALGLWGVERVLDMLPSDRDLNLLVADGRGERLVFKVANAEQDPDQLAAETRIMQAAARGQLAVPAPRPSLGGNTLEWAQAPSGVRYACRLMSWVEGRTLAELDGISETTLLSFGAQLARLDELLASLSEPALQRDLPWDLDRGVDVVAANLSQVGDARRRALLQESLADTQERFSAPGRLLDRALVHNDPNDHNVLVGPGPGHAVTGIIDFGDALVSYRIADLAIAGAYVALRASHPLEPLLPLAKAYHELRPLSDLEVHMLLPLVRLRCMVSVAMSALQTQREPGNAYLSVSEQAAWRTLERFRYVDLAAGERALRRTLGFPGANPRRAYPAPDGETLRQRRDDHLGPSLSLSYDRPLTIVGGWKQHLFDAEGEAYLDCVNNVCHVGHAHPRVADAIAAQARVLNTNTRYLHPFLAQYAERLGATLPGDLSVCYFVSSGSEANELALRMARVVTGRQGVVALEGGYHGNTTTLVDVSHYKFAGPGGNGAPHWLVTAAMPDPFRGVHRGAPNPAEAHLADLGQALAQAQRSGGAAAFLAESILSCGGQIVPPAGYLARAFDQARASGALAISDEVQTGFGRVGSHMWAFEAAGARPDIVTLGKPIGNGHPLGAVVTTPAIADAFANGMEYFATYGGNPVSMAAGLAVLDVLEDEDLMAHAATVGTHLLDGLDQLAQTDTRVGDIRGAGLFLGVEVVRGGTALQPDPELAHALVQAARSRRVLLSTDGPDHNVIKIKPPMPFTSSDADRLVGTLEWALKVVEL